MGAPPARPLRARAGAFPSAPPLATLPLSTPPLAGQDAAPIRRRRPMAEDPVLLRMDERGIATATLNRPHVGNAYNEDLLNALIAGLDRLRDDPGVRALVIRGAG